MNWKLKSFDELSAAEIYQILQLRSEVFVVEQTCVYQDIDGKDQASLHLWAEENGEVIAYCRLMPRGIFYPDAAIGRVIVREPARGRGLAREMMLRAIDIIEKDWQEPLIRIEAQYYVREFYASCGFEIVSEPFLDDGIKHVEMIRRNPHA